MSRIASAGFRFASHACSLSLSTTLCFVVCVLAFRRGDRQLGLQAGVLMLTVWAVDTIGMLRGLKQEYFLLTDPLIVIAGQEYGTGSSRDWAAKGTQLLGVKAVVAKSFERIHRSNLVGMGVLPCQFKGNDSVQSLNITGEETYDLIGVEGGNIKPLQDVTLVIHRKDGSSQNVTVTLRVDSPIEVEYLKHGGILPYVLRELMAS